MSSIDVYVHTLGVLLLKNTQVKETPLSLTVVIKTLYVKVH